MSRFFIVIPPGFEELAERELRTYLNAFGLPNDIALEPERGGIGLELPLEIGFALNLYLKIPSRILLRLSDFKCRDFPKLYKKFRGFDWSPWIFPGAPMPEFSVSSHGSRLAIKKRILSACEDGFAASPVGKTSEQKEVPSRNLVMVRFTDDVCTVSLDTSGEHLHKRGYKLHTTEAPLRENLASALLFSLCNEVDAASRQILIDPMVGSGTFLTEAARIGLTNERDFAFLHFGDVRSGALKVPRLTEVPSSLPKFDALYGYDLDDKTLAAAKENLKSAGILSQSHLVKADSFEQKKLEFYSGQRILVCNPPYGERIKIQGPLTMHYSRMLNNFAFRFSPDLVGVILPEKANYKQLHLPQGWRLTGQTAFENGGLPVVFYRFTCA